MKIYAIGIAKHIQKSQANLSIPNEKIAVKGGFSHWRTKRTRKFFWLPRPLPVG